MGAHLQEWLGLLIRMAHFISGIMWIGTSFYFVWMDSAFEPKAESSRDGVEGELSMVHGGFFYRVEKRRFGVGPLPKILHWFKWEATLTWITGFLMLWVVYYTTGGVYLIDPANSSLTPNQATGLALALLFGSWIAYDGLFRSPLSRTPFIYPVALVAVGGLVYGLTHWFSGRGAFIHLGAIFGTWMVLNVWVHILPNQKAIIRAAEAGQEPNYELGKKAKRRSIHNSYMTLPVLFMMISNHYSVVTHHPHSTWILVGIIVAGACVRHTMITLKWTPLIPAFLVIGWLFWVTLPPGLSSDSSTVQGLPSSALAAHPIGQIIQDRCVNCHSTHPTDAVFKTPPVGIVFDSPAQIDALAERIDQRVYVQKTMPMNNQTHISDAEREAVHAWATERARTK